MGIGLHLYVLPWKWECQSSLRDKFFVRKGIMSAHKRTVYC
jgi:hypothetical protein